MTSAWYVRCSHVLGDKVESARSVVPSKRVERRKRGAVAAILTTRSGHRALRYT